MPIFVFPPLMGLGLGWWTNPQNMAPIHIQRKEEVGHTMWSYTLYYVPFKFFTFPTYRCFWSLLGEVLLKPCPTLWAQGVPLFPDKYPNSRPIVGPLVTHFLGCICILPTFLQNGRRRNVFFLFGP